MHSCNTASLILSLALMAGGLGCSGSAGGDAELSVALAALDPGVGVSLEDPGACIVTTRARSLGVDDAGDFVSTYRWRSYFAEQRIVRDVALDGAGRPFPSSSGANDSTYTRLDEVGRTLVWATEVGDGELQRFDYSRDGRGNVVSQRQIYTVRRNLAVTPPEEPSVAYDFVNHYSSAGLLEKHNRTDASASIRYAHDAEGRCQRIVGRGRVEQREYDAGGRLRAQLLIPLGADGALDPLDSAPSSITTHAYDDQGRPLAVEQDGGGPAALPIDGEPDMQTLFRHADDGSWQIEYIDFTSETPNDMVDRNGALAFALRRVEAWSPGCAALQASIPVPTGSACRAD